MMKKTIIICTAVALVFVLTPLATAFVTVDPDAFPPGTVLNNAYPGVTLSALGNYSGADGNVYARTDSLASTGTQIFGNSWFGQEWGFDDTFQPHLRIDFASPVSWVSIDAIGNNSEDYGRLEAYSSGGTLLVVS